MARPAPRRPPLDPEEWELADWERRWERRHRRLAAWQQFEERRTQLEARLTLGGFDKWSIPMQQPEEVFGDSTGDNLTRDERLQDDLSAEKDFGSCEWWAGCSQWQSS